MLAGSISSCLCGPVLANESASKAARWGSCLVDSLIRLSRPYRSPNASLRIGRSSVRPSPSTVVAQFSAQRGNLRSADRRSPADTTRMKIIRELTCSHGSHASRLLAPARHHPRVLGAASGVGPLRSVLRATEGPGPLGRPILSSSAERNPFRPRRSRLHALCWPASGDAGQFRCIDNDIVRLTCGKAPTIRFRCVTAKEKPEAISELCERNEQALEECRADYHECLHRRSQRWHQGRHELTPWFNFILAIIRRAYAELYDLARNAKAPRGTKAELVLAASRAYQGEFRLKDLQRDCPSVGRDWIRTILANLKKSGDMACSGRGPAARWHLLRSKGSNAQVRVVIEV